MRKWQPPESSSLPDITRNTPTPTSANCAQRVALSSLGNVPVRLCAVVGRANGDMSGFGVFNVFRCNYCRS